MPYCLTRLDLRDRLDAQSLGISIEVPAPRRAQCIEQRRSDLFLQIPSPGEQRGIHVA
jgi:hypothetical protein